jgi:hypothetical protein
MFILLASVGAPQGATDTVIYLTLQRVKSRPFGAKLDVKVVSICVESPLF